MKRLRFAVFSPLLLLVVSACDESPAPPAPAAAPASRPAPTALGFTAFCPLCIDHELEVMSDTPTSVYEGKTYYFCSPSCKRHFEKNPAGELAKQAARQVTTAPGMAPATTPTTAPAAH